MALLCLGRLKQRKEFVRAASEGQKAVTSSIVLQAVPMVPTGYQQAIDSRVGFTVTKKVGNAVVRNRVKRRMRAAAQDIMPEYGQANMDYVLIGRKFCVQCPYDTLLKDLIYALGKVH